MDNQGFIDKGVSAFRSTTDTATDLDLIHVYAPEGRGKWQVKELPLSNSDVWVCQISKDFLVCLHNRAKKQILEHATETIRREVGGALIGAAYQSGRFRFIEITAAIRGNFTRGSAARLTFTADTWSEIIRIAETDYKDQCIVGWYHTHPNLGVFLSDLDLDIQNNFFDQPDQVALVVDPIRKNGKFFYGTLKNNRGVQASAEFTWDHALYFSRTVSQETVREESHRKPQGKRNRVLHNFWAWLLGRPPEESKQLLVRPSSLDVEPPILQVTAADIPQEVKPVPEEYLPSQPVAFDVVRGFVLAVFVGLVFILLVGGVVATRNSALKEFPITWVGDNPTVVLLGCLVLLMIGVIIARILWPLLKSNGSVK